MRIRTHTCSTYAPIPPAGIPARQQWLFDCRRAGPLVPRREAHHEAVSIDSQGDARGVGARAVAGSLVVSNDKPSRQSHGCRSIDRRVAPHARLGTRLHSHEASHTDPMHKPELRDPASFNTQMSLGWQSQYGSPAGYPPQPSTVAPMLMHAEWVRRGCVALLSPVGMAEGSSPAAKQAGQKKNETMTPLTVRQLHTAIEGGMDPPIVDGEELNQVGAPLLRTPPSGALYRAIAAACRSCHAAALVASSVAELRCDGLTPFRGTGARQLTIIGKVTGVNPTSTMTIYKLDDGTGVVEVRERVLCVSLARCLAPSLSSHLSLARRTPSRARRAAG